MMDLVLLRDAKVMCIGSERGEMICREIASFLWQLGKKPCVGVRYKRRRTDENVTVPPHLVFFEKRWSRN